MSDEALTRRLLFVDDSAFFRNMLAPVLKAAGYKGYYGFEWEKAWHPEIEEPEVALPQYAEMMKRWLT